VLVSISEVPHASSVARLHFLIRLGVEFDEASLASIDGQWDTHRSLFTMRDLCGGGRSPPRSTRTVPIPNFDKRLLHCLGLPTAASPSVQDANELYLLYSLAELIAACEMGMKE
jgi:hypothetical protein